MYVYICVSVYVTCRDRWRLGGHVTFHGYKSRELSLLASHFREIMQFSFIPTHLCIALEYAVLFTNLVGLRTESCCHRRVVVAMVLVVGGAHLCAHEHQGRASLVQQKQ